MKVFLSVGATYSAEQEQFVRAFEDFLIQNSCQRLTVGRGSLGASQPIMQARNLMEQADAIVVLAFTRVVVKTAIDKPGSPDESQITDTKYPTIWNQLEASMGFGLKLPLLVILEKGLHQEAMLKDRLEFRTWITPLNPDFFRSDEFKGVFADFKKIASERAAGSNSTRNTDVGTWTIGRLCKELRPDQFWKMGAALLGLISALLAAAFWLGKHW